MDDNLINQDETDPKDETSRYPLIAPTAWTMRGLIINETIYLERLIDEFLGRHFCPDKIKRSELFELILGNERISFESKRQILKFVMDKHFKTVVDTNKNIFSDLKEIIDERNFLAHQLLDTSDEAFNKLKENKIGFVKFRNSTETTWYDNDKINTIRKLIVAYIKLFSDELEKTQKEHY
jgi:hypothetical protein